MAEIIPVAMSASARLGEPLSSGAGSGIGPIATVPMEEAAHGAASCVLESLVPHETPESITQATPIAEADRFLHMTPVVVHADDSLKAVAEKAVENTGCRVIAVVDDQDRLVGVIPVRVLVNDIFLKIVPEEFLGEILDLEGALKYAEHIGARTARDVMLPPESVGADESVRDAFERMHAAKLSGLPIVDEDGRVAGYVDQLELLLVWVRASGRDALLKPTAEGGE
jgi:CBS domain-containing protein